eukprot:COSAG02_NODE_55066_length_292_cov_1.316062_1_plen_25_part_01
MLKCNIFKMGIFWLRLQLAKKKVRR